MNAYIAGLGSYVPEKILTNFDLEKIVETSDEWIRTRSGVKERRISAEDEPTSELAVAAGRKALKANLPWPAGLNLRALRWWP